MATVDLRPGTAVTPSLRLDAPLGEGGMGSVWVATHHGLRTQVVVKFISEELSRRPDAVQRFAKEAAAASQVKSPHVVQMLDHGVMQGGRPYIVMELLEGEDLATRLERAGPLAPDEAAAVVTQLSRALSKAHELRIVHRDVKPSNVFLCDNREDELFVKLLDFGVAKADTLTVEGSTTKSGAFIGSPFYMSPEQLLGSKDVDARSDAWALAVLAFEALTGRRPFEAETVAGLALRIHSEPPPRVTALRPELPLSVDAWFARACSKSPDDRYPHVRALAEAFSASLQGASVSIRPSGAVAPHSGSGSDGGASGAFAATVSAVPSNTHGSGATAAADGSGASNEPSRSSAAGVPRTALVPRVAWVLRAVITVAALGVAVVGFFAWRGSAKEAAAVGSGLASPIAEPAASAMPPALASEAPPAAASSVLSEPKPRPSSEVEAAPAAKATRKPAGASTKPAGASTKPARSAAKPHAPKPGTLPAVDDDIK